MALLEQEAIPFARSLDDYEHVTVTDTGGGGPIGYGVVVRDHRFDIEYEIASHCDYWDFIGAWVSIGSLFRRVGSPLRRDRVRPSDDVISRAGVGTRTLGPSPNDHAASRHTAEIVRETIICGAWRPPATDGEQVPRIDRARVAWRP